jgi:hypothetical protein
MLCTALPIPTLCTALWALWSLKRFVFSTWMLQTLGEINIKICLCRIAYNFKVSLGMLCGAHIHMLCTALGALWDFK